MRCTSPRTPYAQQVTAGDPLGSLRTARGRGLGDRVRGLRHLGDDEMKTKRASSKFELWEVAHNLTTKRWIIWRNGSPSIAECVVEADADRICALLNKARVQ